MTPASVAAAPQRVRENTGAGLPVTDFHVAAGETGVQVISRVRREPGAPLEAVLIGGDTSSAVKGLSQDSDLRIVSKPVHAEAFLELVRDLLAAGS